MTIRTAIRPLPVVTGILILAGALTAAGCIRQGNVARPSLSGDALHAGMQTQPEPKADAAEQSLPGPVRAPAMASQDGPIDALGRSTRVRIERRPGGKYPLIRIEEDLQADGMSGRPLATREMVADHLLVTMRDANGLRMLAGALPAGTSIRRAIRGSHAVLIRIPANAPGDLPRARAALAAIPGVAAAEPDWIVHLELTPNDPSYAQQWALNNTGQIGGTADADIDAPEAWEYATGSRSVKVGVIDTGIDLTHPDLQANLWTNPGEIPGNGIDDDGNGYIDDVHGWNFVGDNANPQDDHFHGTHVAGTIGATGGNGLGVAGVCPQVSLVALKFLDANGSGATSDAVEAVLYADAIGCDLTSNSWGGGEFSQALKDAIDLNGANGRLFIAAAGNSAMDLDGTPSYPASYDCPNIISVAATDHGDALASFSNHGDPAVHIAAPGVDILGTLPMVATPAMASRGYLPGYGVLSGTSMAAPHVSGAAALLKAAEPSLSAAQLRDRILARGDVKPGLAEKVLGARRLNLASLFRPAPAVSAAQVVFVSAAMDDSGGDGDGLASPGEVVAVQATCTNSGSSAATALHVAVGCSGGTVLSGGDQMLADLDPSGSSQLPMAATIRIDPEAVPGSMVTLTFAYDWADGSSTGQKQFQIVPPLAHASAAVPFAVAGTAADEVAGIAYALDATTPALLAIDTAAGRLVGRRLISGAVSPSCRLEVGVHGDELFIADPANRTIRRFSLPGLSPTGSLTTAFSPVAVCQAANGLLYAHDGSRIHQVDIASGADLAQFGTLFLTTALRMDAPRTTLYQAGMSFAAPGYAVHAWNVQTAGIPTLSGSSAGPYGWAYDLVVDADARNLYVAAGQVHAIRLDVAGSAIWPSDFFPIMAVGSPTGSGCLYAAGGRSLGRYIMSSGSRLGSCQLTGDAGFQVVPGSLAMTALDQGVAVLKRARSDGGGQAGADWRLALVGSPRAVLDNHPTARAVVTYAGGATVLCVGTGSTDPDGGALAYRWDFGDGATATGAEARHDYAVRGTYAVSLLVTDAEGLEDNCRSSVLVDTSPQAVSQDLTAQEDVLLPITLSAIDPDGDALTYQIVDGPVRGRLWGAPPVLQYQSAYNQGGSDIFTFRASDGVASSIGTVTLTISAVDDPPVVKQRSVLTTPGVPAQISIMADDIDSVLTYGISRAPVSGTLTGTPPLLTYTPAPGFAGLDAFDYTVSDATTTVAATVQIRVNRPPEIADASLTVPFNGQASLTIAATDPDGQPVSLLTGGSPTKGEVLTNGLVCTYIARTGASGSDRFTVTGYDGYHFGLPAVVEVTIPATNPWPEADLPAAETVGHVGFVPMGSEFAIAGSGALGTADGGRYTWTGLAAGGEIRARVTAREAAAAGGLMVRAGTEAGSVMAAVVAGADGELELVVRDQADGESLTVATASAAVPCWLRLQRTASGVAASWSADGSAWSGFAAADLQLPDSVLAGLWGGSSDGSLAVTTCDQVRTILGGAPSWPTLGAGPARTGRVAGSFPADFVQVWHAQAGGNLNPVSVSDGLVVASGWISQGPGWVKAYHLASGQAAWTWDMARADAVNPPAAADGRILVQRNDSTDANLWCLSSATGTPLWASSYASYGARMQAPCLDLDGVFVGGGCYGGMYGFDVATGAQRFYVRLPQYDRWSPSTAGGSLFSWVDGILGAHDPATGAISWSLACDTWTTDASAVITGQTALVRGGSGLHAVDLVARTRLWGQSGAFGGMPAVGDGIVYAIIGSELRAYRLGDGVLVQTFAATGTLLDQPIVADDAVIVASSARTWVLDRSTFAVRQLIEAGGHPCLAGRSLILAGIDGVLRSLESVAVDAATPTADAVEVTTSEDAPVDIVLSGTDPDGDLLAFQVLSAPSAGTLSGTGGRLVFAPPADASGVYAFLYRVSDGIHASLPAQVRITVTPVADRPSVDPMTVAVVSGHPATFAPRVTDPDSYVFTLAVAQPPGHGSVSISGSTITYQPVAGFIGADTIRVEAGDGMLWSDPTTIVLDVRDPIPGKLLAPEGASGQRFGQGVAISGDWAAVGAPLAGRGEVHIYHREGGRWSHQATIPAPAGSDDYAGISVALHGTTLAVARCSVSLARATVYERQADGAWLERQPVVAMYAAPAVAGGEGVLGSDGGAWVGLDGDVLVLGAPLDGYGAATVYRRDGNGDWRFETRWSAGSTRLRFGWGVAVSGDRIVIGAHKASEGAGAVVAYRRNGGVWDAGTEIRLASPGLNDWFGFSVALDGDRMAVGAPQRDAGPAADAGAVYVYRDEGSAWVLEAELANQAGDPAWDQLGKAVAMSRGRIIAAAPYAWTDGIGATGSIASWTRGPTEWTVESRRTIPDASDGDWLTEHLALEGHDAIIGSPRDGDLGTWSGSAYVLSYDAAPVLNPQTFVIVEDGALDAALAAADPDLDALAWSVAVPPLHGAAAVGGGRVTYRPAADWSGTDAVTVRVDDGYESADAVITVLVRAVNDPPSVRSIRADMLEDDALEAAIVAADAEGDALVPSIAIAPVHGTAGIDGWTLQYRPDADWYGTETFSIQVSDGAAIATAVVEVAVGAVNDRPVVAPLSGSIQEGAVAELAIVASDPDDDVLSAGIAIQPAHGTASLIGWTLIYRPAPGWHGVDACTVAVDDGALTADVVATITVRAVNHPPTAAAIVATVDEDGSVDMQVVAADPDGDALSAMVISGPDHGRATLDGWIVTYRPDADWHGVDSFAVQVSDGDLLATAAATITVTPVNDRPSARDDAFALAAGETRVASLRGSDPDGDPLSWRIATASPSLVASIEGQSVSVRGVGGFAGAATFTVACSDGQAESDPATVTVTVGRLPVGWASSDIGATGAAGSAVWNAEAGAWTLTGAGVGVAGRAADACRFADRPVGGDFDLVARIPFLPSAVPTACAGLMLRESLDPGARTVFVGLRGNRKVAWSRRIAERGPAGHTLWPAAVPPFVRLSRRGNVVTSYRSSDGVSWTSCGAVTMALPEVVLVGPCVAGGAAGRLMTVTMTGSVLDLPTPAPAGGIAIDFRPGVSATIEAGGTWQPADGAAFGARWCGLTYGFASPTTAVYDRDSRRSPDQQSDTGVEAGLANRFEVAVPDGWYAVTICVGDASLPRGVLCPEVEGVLAMTLAVDAGHRWGTATVDVEVRDGRLTLGCGAGATASRWSWLRMEPMILPTPGDG